MKKVIVALIIIVINILYSHPILKRPLEFNKPQSGLVTTGRVFSNRDRAEEWLTCWDAYSDRDNNTYYQGDCMTPIGTLSFLDPVWIIDETDDWVAYGIKTNIDVRKDRREVDEKGWIKKDKLLLWKQSLKNEHNINRKAIITKKYGDEISALEFNLFSDPELHHEVNYIAKIFDIYYIYKQINDSYLVGINDHLRISVGQTPKLIIGWINANRIATWDTRVAIEPNWQFSRLQDSSDPLCKYFLNELSALKYFHGQPIDNSQVVNQLVISESQERDLEDEYYSAAYKQLVYDERYRKPGQWFRYPIIDNNFDDDTYKVLVSVRPSCREEDKMYSAVEEMMQRLEAMRTLNFVFVIDGTASMGKYFTPVSDGIKESISQIENKSNKENKLKFGAVIYRDIYNGQTKYLIDHQRLTNPQEMSKFLNSSLVGFSAGDETKGEALFYGLNYALDNMFPEESGQVNVLILIGDTGDNGYGSIQLRDLKNKLVQKNCWMLAFQVNKGRHPAYSSFIDDSKRLLMDVALQHYENMRKDITGNLLDRMNIVQPSWSSSMNAKSGYDIHRITNSSILARLYEPAGKEIRAEYLEEEIEKFIIDVNQDVTNIRETVYSTIQGEILVGSNSKNIFTESGKYEPFILKLLKDSCADNEILEVLTGSNFLYSAECYTITNFDNPLPEDLHKPVILLSRDELNDVYNSFRRFVELGNDNDATTYEKIEALIDSWKELLASFCGDSEVGLENSTFGEMRQKVTGIPVSNSWLDDIDINSIDIEIHKNPNRFSVYYDKIIHSVNILGDILRDENYPSSFTVRGNNKYFWIDIDLFP
ncbi:MAG: VWA domain-containing protein [Candidatus Cloacimonetes bacterium]|nr:VWA domain-containing protein [Candidatus Cloacimonadota bacterium]